MSDFELKIFSERIKELRTKMGMTQAKFVEGIGITSSALSAYEKMQKVPSLAVAKKIAEKYNVSLDWLCGLSDQMENNKTLETYSDIIKELGKISEAINFNVRLKNESDCEPPFREAYIVIDEFDDEPLYRFLVDWKNILDLYKAGTINKDLYRLWIDDQTTQYKEANIKRK